MDFSTFVFMIYCLVMLKGFYLYRMLKGQVWNGEETKETWPNDQVDAPGAEYGL